MNSVGRRILGRPTGSIVTFVDETARNEVSRALAPTVRSLPLVATPVPVMPPVGPTRGFSGVRKAICVGIDAYPAPNTLAGCVNDARDWAAVLESLAFDVTLLLNQQATRLAILDAIERAVTAAQPGDVIAIQYSGHGTQVKDLDGDETDGLDEALVPIDFTAGSFIIDDDLRSLMVRIPVGVNVTCFMDCCHSGSNTRLFAPTPVTQLDGSRMRFLPMTPDLTNAHVAMRSRTRQLSVPPARIADEMREVNFAACRPDQVAFETNGSGEFTRRAATILRAGITGITNDAFQRSVLEAFGAGARQQPVLHCASGSEALPLLGGRADRLDVLAVSKDSEVLISLLNRLDTIERRLAKLGG
jgi:Caspase domain